VYGSNRNKSKDDPKNCTPLRFETHLDDKGEVIGDGWYWSKQTRSHCCLLHYAALAKKSKRAPELTLANYEKVDKTTFHKFLFRLDFSTDMLIKSESGHDPDFEFDPCFLSIPCSTPLTLPKILTEHNNKFSSFIKDKVVRNLRLLSTDGKNVIDELLKNLAYINAGNDYLRTPTFHPDFGSLHGWTPFDHDEMLADKEEEEEEKGIIITVSKPGNYRGKKVKQKVLKRYALVYCDQENKELFGQVATSVVTETILKKNDKEDNKNDKDGIETFVDMTYINIEEYLSRKYGLTDKITEILDQDIRLPQPLIDIIIQYSSYEENNFIKNLRKSSGYIL
jgi:hypothetical protein